MLEPAGNRMTAARRTRSGGSTAAETGAQARLNTSSSSPRNDYREFRRLVGAAGLRRIRLHDVRYTAASLMLARA